MFEQQRNQSTAQDTGCPARRGRDTLRFGPMKPVGLTHPHTGRRPYAVVLFDEAVPSLTVSVTSVEPSGKVPVGVAELSGESATLPAFQL